LKKAGGGVWYYREHVVDLDSELVLAAEVYPADCADPATLVDSVLKAQLNLVRTRRGWPNGRTNASTWSGICCTARARYASSWLR
jgi:hypothetical protein